MSKRFLIIEHRHRGMFSNLFHVLQWINRCREIDRVPIVHWHGGHYYSEAGYNGEKNNVWQYYFEPVSNYTMDDVDLKHDDVKRKNKYRLRTSQDEPLCCWDFKRATPPKPGVYNPSAECRKFFNKVVVDHIKLRDVVQGKIEQFANEHFSGAPRIGVHMRGCDDAKTIKGIKTRRTRRRYLDRLIDYYVSKIKEITKTYDDNVQIFIASDYQYCVDRISGMLGLDVITYDSFRSNNGHIFNTNQSILTKMCVDHREYEVIGPQRGEEAIIECMLLSKCNYFFKSVSNFSSAVLYFNPNIQYETMISYDK